jgi:hypothetical protein
MSRTFLLNGKQLAATLNVPTMFVTAMKARGFVFSYGGRTLLDDAMAWLKEHPKFRYSDYIEEHRKTPKMPPARPPPRSRPQPRVACK